MSEVSTWNAVDASNTATPPDGWPEGQQPSSVNDCGRMMMGALRREHDRVTAQIGSVAGTISTTTINATTISTTGAITASGPITGTAINSTGNASVAGTLTAGAVSTSSIAGGIGGTVNIGTGSTGNLAHINLFADQVNATGTVTVAQLTSTGHIASVNIDATGYITAAGDMACYGTFYANGNANVTGNLSVSDQITCRHLYSSGDAALGSWKFYVSNAIWCADQLAPAVDGGTYCGLAAFAWLGVESYNFYTKSDPALKRDIEPVPPGCLGLVNAIDPRMYKLDLEADEGKTHWGFLAPEVGEVMQRAGVKFDGVRNEGDASSSLAYNEMIAVLWGAVQELTQQVEALKQEKTDV